MTWNTQVSENGRTRTNISNTHTLKHAVWKTVMIHYWLILIKSMKNSFNVYVLLHGRYLPITEITCTLPRNICQWRSMKSCSGEDAYQLWDGTRFSKSVLSKGQDSFFITNKISPKQKTLPHQVVTWRRGKDTPEAVKSSPDGGRGKDTAEADWGRGKDTAEADGGRGKDPAEADGGRGRDTAEAVKSSPDAGVRTLLRLSSSVLGYVLGNSENWDLTTWGSQLHLTTQNQRARFA